MSGHYRCLIYEERCQIEVLKKSGLSQNAITQQLGRDLWLYLHRRGKKPNWRVAVMLVEVISLAE